MITVNSYESIEQLIKDNQMVLVYFGGNNCSVCSAMKPKIEELLESYPKIKSAGVTVEEAISLSAAYNVFTIPAILLFIEGKEVLREARHISIDELEMKISRYYTLLFG